MQWNASIVFVCHGAPMINHQRIKIFLQIIFKQATGFLFFVMKHVGNGLDTTFLLHAWIISLKESDSSTERGKLLLIIHLQSFDLKFCLITPTWGKNETIDCCPDFVLALADLMVELMVFFSPINTAKCIGCVFKCVINAEGLWSIPTLTALLALRSLQIRQIQFCPIFGWW